MKPLTASELHGNWGTLLLPIDEDDSINFEHLTQEINSLIEFQVDGIYTNGTAGEFYNQSEEEFDRVSELLSEMCHAVKSDSFESHSDMPFQIGVSHSSPIISRERLRRTVKLRPSAMQLILPDWSPLSNAEAISFLQTMAEEADGIGLVLYHPPHAKRKLTPEDFAELKNAVPTLIGIKFFGGDAAWFAEMKRLVPNISIFVPGHLLADGVPLGASGAYSNVACLHPGAAQDWVRSMNETPEAAMELSGRIQTFMSEHIVPLIQNGYSNQAVDKLLACIGGWTDISTKLRWPYHSIPASEVKRLQPIAMEILPEFFPPP